MSEQTRQLAERIARDLFTGYHVNGWTEAGLTIRIEKHLRHAAGASVPQEAVREAIEAARNADWMQVVLNQGPPCFHYERETGRFCLRAQRWAGHGRDVHEFVSVAALLSRLTGEASFSASHGEHKLRERFEPKA